jgi:hypothetical protein
MNATPLEKLFEHNHWANLKTLMACAALSDEQLDAAPLSATKGTIRITLTHLIASQQGYLELLTLPVEQRRPRGPVPYDTLEASARASGEALLALVGNLPEHFFEKRLQTTDGYSVEPWVVLVQAGRHPAQPGRLGLRRGNSGADAACRKDRKQPSGRISPFSKRPFSVLFSAKTAAPRPAA